MHGRIDQSCFAVGSNFVFMHFLILMGIKGDESVMCTSSMFGAKRLELRMKNAMQR